MTLHSRLARSMTRAQKRAHVAGLRDKAALLRRANDRRGAELLEKAAEEFAAEHLPKKRQRVTWNDP